MDKIIDTLNESESYPIHLGYDINDVNQSLRETIKAIEIFIFDRRQKKDKLNQS